MTQRTTAPEVTGTFSGKKMSTTQMMTGQMPLSVLLRHSIALDQTQELALQRLQQGEHKSLAKRSIRVL